MKKMLLPLIAVCCMAPVAAFAGHPLVTDSATTVEPKHIEAETSAEYHIIDNDGAKGKSVILQEVVTFGIIPKVDAFVAVPFSFLSPDAGKKENGINDVTIGAKWNFMQAGSTELAVKPIVVLPTGDDKKGLGAGKSSFGAVLAASGEVSKQLGYQANAGIMHQLAPENGKAYNTWAFGAACTFEASKELKAVAEAAFSKTDLDGSKLATKLTAGAVYAVTGTVDVDGGVNYSIQDKNKDLGIVAGVTFKF